MADLTRILEAARAGDAEAASALFPLIYEELRQIARAKMRQEKPGQTLQATALVHEAWLRLGGQRFDNRAHFFGAAAEAMRRILIDNARRRAAARHGGGAERVDLEAIEVAAPARDVELLAIHETLDAFAAHEPRKAELVKLRYFVGCTIDEAAEVLGISAPTAKRDWAYARAWLFRAMNELPEGAPRPGAGA
ncbi:MAG: sigma-70 family RNA polymerase sigma factor [Verrucomicrobia bacterium]|nr:sigma-70 family RNA polymerase sigma factor [Verrucomicrobiota bacterium]